MDRLKFSDYIATVAFFISLVAIYQTHEANSPKIEITSVTERSYSTCNENVGEWQTRSIMRFNVSNIGGRATAIERLTQSNDVPPVLIKTAEYQKPASSYSIVRLKRLTDLREGTSARSWDLNKVFDEGELLTLSGNKDDLDIMHRGHIKPPLLNIPIDAGKSVTLEFGVSTGLNDGNKHVKSVSLALVASFSHKETKLLRADSETQRLIIRGGRCERNMR